MTNSLEKLKARFPNDYVSFTVRRYWLPSVHTEGIEYMAAVDTNFFDAGSEDALLAKIEAFFDNQAEVARLKARLQELGA
jgi:hypothetical protein